MQANHLSRLMRRLAMIITALTVGCVAMAQTTVIPDTPWDMDNPATNTFYINSVTYTGDATKFRFDWRTGSAGEYVYNRVDLTGADQTNWKSTGTSAYGTFGWGVVTEGTVAYISVRNAKTGAYVSIGAKSLNNIKVTSTEMSYSGSLLPSVRFIDLEVTVEDPVPASHFTINVIGDLAKIQSFFLGRDFGSLSLGENTLTFYETENPICQILPATGERGLYSVTHNGSRVALADNDGTYYYSIRNLRDGDVVEVRTDGSGQTFDVLVKYTGDNVVGSANNGAGIEWPTTWTATLPVLDGDFVRIELDTQRYSIREVKVNGEVLDKVLLSSGVVRQQVFGEGNVIEIDAYLPNRTFSFNATSYPHCGWILTSALGKCVVLGDNETLNMRDITAGPDDNPWLISARYIGIDPNNSSQNYTGDYENPVEVIRLDGERLVPNAEGKYYINLTGPAELSLGVNEREYDYLPATVACTGAVEGADVTLKFSTDGINFQPVNANPWTVEAPNVVWAYLRMTNAAPDAVYNYCLVNETGDKYYDAFTGEPLGEGQLAGTTVTLKYPLSKFRKAILQLEPARPYTLDVNVEDATEWLITSSIGESWALPGEGDGLNIGALDGALNIRAVTLPTGLAPFAAYSAPGVEEILPLTFNEDGLAVFTPEFNDESLTAGTLRLMSQNSSDVDAPDVDAAAAPRYYNLGGVPVDNPVAGAVNIRVAGNSAAKVLLTD